MRTVARHHEERRQREERGRRDAQTRLRRIAASAAREIEYFWSNIEQVGAGLFVGPENLGVGAGEPSATGAVAQCPRRRSDALGRLAPQRAGRFCVCPRAETCQPHPRPRGPGLLSSSGSAGGWGSLPPGGARLSLRIFKTLSSHHPLGSGWDAVRRDVNGRVGGAFPFGAAGAGWGQGALGAWVQV